MTEALAPSSLLLPMFSTVAMRAVVDDGARVQRMLDFAAALARAEAAVGVIPHEAVDPITAAAKVERYPATLMSAEAHEHERAAGAWRAEWATFPALLLAVSGALACIADIGERLEVDSDRMRANFEATLGVTMAPPVAVALAGELGKSITDQVMDEAIHEALAEKRHLREVLGEDDRVTLLMNPGEPAKLFEPLSYQGVAQTFIERLVASAQSRVPRR